MKKLLLAVIMLLAFTSNASANANKPLIFGLQLIDAIEYAAGPDAPGYRDEGGYRMYLSLNASTMFAITPEFAIHAGLGIEYRYFSFDIRDTVNAMGVSTTGGWTAESSENEDMDYSVGLSIPLMARYFLFDGFYGELGTIIDINFFEKFKPYFTDEYVDISEQNTLNVGIGGGVGYIFSFGLEINGMFTYGLTNLYSNADWVGHRIYLNVAYWFNYR
ncbi:MAG: outer membrane beta-barrel protein [Fibrobacter sp.]|jgi:opacity protein-like surface antigen|nr:outer membrane beta-barrel protein [Fibrobacter sp.]